jgi:hypothetical protein
MSVSMITATAVCEYLDKARRLGWHVMMTQHRMHMRPHAVANPYAGPFGLPDQVVALPNLLARFKHSSLSHMATVERISTSWVEHF